MKVKKGVYISIFLSVFLLYFGIMFEYSLVYKVDNFLKFNDNNKISVIVNNFNEANFFNLSDINFLKNKAGNENILAISEVKGKIYSEGRELEGKVLGVTSNLNKFCNIDMVTGNFFNESDNEYSAVIEDKLAYKLFGNENVKGLRMKILDKEFKIAGVIKKDSDIVQTTGEDGYDKIYIPLSTLIKINSKAQISYLQFQNLNGGTPEKDKDIVISLLTTLGKNQQQYKIIDYSTENRLMKQKPLILIFILGALCIWNLFKYLKNMIIQIVRIFNLNLKNEYLLEIIKKHKKELFIYLLKISFIISAMIIFWKLIKFDAYIPAKYIPDEIIDISYYLDLFKLGIKQGMNSRAYLISFMEQKYINANILINISFAITLGSIILIDSSVKRLFALCKDYTFVSTYCVKYSVIALILIGIIFTGLKISIITDFKYLIVIWLFIFMCSVKEMGQIKI